MGNITTAASKGDWSGVKRCVERGDNIHTRDKVTIHTYIRTYTQTYIHTYIHTYIQCYGGSCDMIYSGVLRLFTVLLVMVAEIYVHIS